MARAPGEEPRVGPGRAEPVAVLPVRLEGLAAEPAPVEQFADHLAHLRRVAMQERDRLLGDPLDLSGDLSGVQRGHALEVRQARHLARQGLPVLLLGREQVEEGLGGLAPLDGVPEVRDPRLDGRALSVECRPPVEVARPVRPQFREGFLDGDLDGPGAECGAEFRDDRLVEDLLPEFDGVGADGDAALVVVDAAVELRSLPAVAARGGDEGAATGPALRESAEEIGRLQVGARGATAQPPRTRGPHERRSGPGAAGLDGRPQGRVDDAERRDLAPEPLGRRALPLGLRAGAHCLLRTVPDHDAAVEVAPEHLADCRRRPAAAVTARRRHPLRVERLGHAREPLAAGVQLEDAPHHGGFGQIDLALDVPVDSQVVVAEHHPARDVPRLGLPAERVMRPLAGAAPLEARREGLDDRHDLARLVGEGDGRVA